MKRGPLRRRTPMRRANPERRAKRFRRAFHSSERVRWIKAMRCLVCGALPTYNAHVVRRSRRGTWRDVVPLCLVHHDELDRIYPQAFDAKHGTDVAATAARLAQEWDER